MTQVHVLWQRAYTYTCHCGYMTQMYALCHMTYRYLYQCDVWHKQMCIYDTGHRYSYQSDVWQNTCIMIQDIPIFIPIWCMTQVQVLWQGTYRYCMVFNVHMWSFCMCIQNLFTWCGSMHGAAMFGFGWLSLTVLHWVVSRSSLTVLHWVVSRSSLTVLHWVVSRSSLTVLHWVVSRFLAWLFFRMDRS